MQAMLGQAPPIQRRSTTAVLCPDCAKCQAYEFAASSAAKDENFKPLWLRHSIFSMCEVHYLTSMRKCLFRSGFDLRVIASAWPAALRRAAPPATLAQRPTLN